MGPYVCSSIDFEFTGLEGRNDHWEHSRTNFYLDIVRFDTSNAHYSEMLALLVSLEVY